MRKLEVARGIRHRCGEYGLAPHQLLFDDLHLHPGDRGASGSTRRWSDEGIRLNKRELPGVLTSLGFSNVSFGLTPGPRRAQQRLPLPLVQAGLDAGHPSIPPTTVPYAESPRRGRQLAERPIFTPGGRLSPLLHRPLLGVTERVGRRRSTPSPDSPQPDASHPDPPPPKDGIEA